VTVRADWIGDAYPGDGGFNAPELLAAAREGAAVIGQPFTIAGQPMAMDGDARVFRALLGLLGVASLAMAGWLVVLMVADSGTDVLVATIGLAVVGIGTLAGRRLVTRTNVVRAVMITSVAILALAAAVALSGEATPALLTATLVAVLIAVPYVDSRMLRRLATAAWATCLLIGLLYWQPGGGSLAGRASHAGIEFLGIALISAVALFAVVHVHARLNAAVERYRVLFQRVPVGMYRTTPDGHFLEANGTFAAMFGLKHPSELVDLDAADMYADPNDRLKFRDAVEREGIAHAIDYRAKALDGHVFWLRDSALLVTDTTGSPLYYEGIVQDVTERKSHELRLEDRARLDALTGLANRGVLVEQLASSLAVAAPSHPVALLFVDLDHFKSVNDNYGHAAGDAVIVEAGRRLSKATRDPDLVARFGGDEFAVLLQAPTGLDVARVVAKRIAASFQAPFELESATVQLAASVGIAVCDSALDAQQLLERADAAMYEAKQATDPNAKVVVFQS
jgi:diguanylate cyclase (GGDEF)-like protein/PAS domain S-box-containing protein